jgi:hypothetical protein
MMHVRMGEDEREPGRRSEDDHSSTHALLLELARRRAALAEAKGVANESLQRLREAPEPHTSDNAIYLRLYDDHCRGREMLFEAMRRLDDV